MMAEDSSAARLNIGSLTAVLILHDTVVGFISAGRFFLNLST